MVDQLFHFASAQRHDPAVEAWFAENNHELAALAKHWFSLMRSCGEDVHELLHDGHPTACVTDAAFAYVNAFQAHVNVGFFRGADLPDPYGLLEGTGKYMRHVKLRPVGAIHEEALRELIQTAYREMKARLDSV